MRLVHMKNSGVNKVTLGFGKAILVRVTTATTNPGMATSPDRLPALNRPNMVSVGTIVFLAQELMFFAGLFAMYFTSRANGMEAGDWANPVSYTHL